jgi:hypothetical protein
LVSTAISTSSASIERSDSSASTTSHSPAPVGVQPGRAQRAADEVAGSIAAAQQRVGDHRGRRRLAVRAGDRDRALQRAELGEQLGARAVAQAALARGGALGVVGATALESTTSTSSPAGTFAASWPTWTSTRAPQRRPAPGRRRGRSPRPRAPSCLDTRA